MTRESSSGRSRAVAYVRTVARQVYYEQLNFWLNPVAAVFTLGFSVVFLILVGSSNGHSRSSAIGGAEVIKYYVPGFMAYGVMAACFNALTISLVVRREMGLLKRLRLSPLPTWALLSAIFVNAAIVSILEVALVMIIGRVGYSVAFPHNFAALVVAIVVGAASFTSLAVGVSTLIPNQDAGGPVTSVVFFVLLFISGLWFPLSPHSGLAEFANWFPVRHLIDATYAAYTGRSGWAWGDIRDLIIWGAVGFFVALRRWSWAPHRFGRGRSPGFSLIGLLGGRRPG